MNNNGYTIILIILVVFVFMLVVSYLGMDNYYTNKANLEIKEEKANIQKQLKECRQPIPEDMRIYWRGSNAFYLQDYEMIKVKNVSDLIRLISQGYIN